MCVAGQEGIFAILVCYLDNCGEEKIQVCSSQPSERENAAGMYHSQEVRQDTGGSTAVG